ncbi:MAG: hypothetical protein HYZ34_08815 [Ignavibacteriae bacterium]|nr:hypothetical protein [Ignavibacteriota bacterium]
MVKFRIGESVKRRIGDTQNGVIDCWSNGERLFTQSPITIHYSPFTNHKS